ncbi:MAG: hypothetical protein HY817_02475 [Candidatus Abawacabacteria bacterium]|nr:hypothetical protein [Candidatus Abawacabacteria bacterium]
MTDVLAGKGPEIGDGMEADLVELRKTRVMVAAAMEGAKGRGLKPHLSACVAQMKARGLASFGDVVAVPNGQRYSVDFNLSQEGLEFSCITLGDSSLPTFMGRLNERDQIMTYGDFETAEMVAVFQAVLNVFMTATTSDGRVSSVGMLPVGKLTQAMPAMQGTALAEFKTKEAAVSAAPESQLLAGYLVAVCNLMAPGESFDSIAFAPNGNKYEMTVRRTPAGVWFSYRVSNQGEMIPNFCPEKITPTTPFKPDVMGIDLAVAPLLARAMLSAIKAKA